MNKGSAKLHQKTQDSLEARLRSKYPHQKITTNVNYYDSDGVILGETDLLRYVSDTRVVMYEVKTSVHGHYSKAQKQYKRFAKHFPELEVKGVYCHPYKGIRRLF